MRSVAVLVLIHSGWRGVEVTQVYARGACLDGGQPPYKMAGQGDWFYPVILSGIFYLPSDEDYKTLFSVIALQRWVRDLEYANFGSFFVWAILCQSVKARKRLLSDKDITSCLSGINGLIL